MENALYLLSGLPGFVAYFACGLALTLAFLFIYTRSTPHNEFKLILEGNNAAAIALSGSLLGFVLPLHSAISHSVGLEDCALWGGVAMIIQLTVFFGLRLCIKNLSQRISEGQTAVGVLVAAASLATGLLNAACMSY
jgi:putative membrane protein